MEAKAVISAVDRTGSVLSGVANKFRQLAGAARQVNGTLGKVATTSRVVAAAQNGVNASTSAMVASVGRYLAPAAVAYGVGRAVKSYAEVERRLTRVGITADTSREEMQAVRKEAQALADEVAMPFDSIVVGFEAMAAQGKSMRDIRQQMPAIARAAQAAGADVNDIANAAGAVGDQMKIAGDRMQAAFDIMIEGGNAGKFELKDMARYLPSLAPLAASVGMAGEEGLQRLVATAQVVRNQTGTAEEAAASLQNIFAKMETDETVKRFKEFGIDLPKAMAKARKEGKDLLTVFTGLADKALKGDLSQIPQLFGDMEFARGMRALLSQKGAVDRLAASLSRADGSTMRALGNVLQDNETKIQRLSSSWNKFVTESGNAATNLGAAAALSGMADSMRILNEEMDRFNAGQRTNAEGNLNVWKNYLLTGQAVDQPASELAAARANMVDRDRLMQTQDLSRQEADRARARMRQFDTLDALPPGSPKREFGFSARATERERLNAIIRRSEELDAAAAALDEVNMQITETVAAQRRLAGLRVNAPSEMRPITPGLMSFGIGGPGGSVRQASPWDFPNGAPLPPARPGGMDTPTLSRLEDILGSGKVEAAVTQPIDVTGKLEAVVSQPIDLTGKVEAEVVGQATVNVRVQVEGGRVTGMAAESSGNIRANVGTSMPQIKAGPR
jgi:TP901 family phage tail tape measure protein